MFDLLTTHSAIKKLSGGKAAALSDMQIVNYIINTQDAKRFLVPDTYKEVEDLFWEYCKRRDKKNYPTETDFWARAAEIAYNFNELANYDY